MELGDMTEEAEEGIRYHWDKSDKLVNVLNEHGVSPYYSWCYVPLPVQPEGGNFRSIPTDWKKYQEIMKAFADHYREQGSPLGCQEIYNEPINPGALFACEGGKGRTVGTADENFRSCISGRQINLKSMDGDQTGASSIHADGRSTMQSMTGAAAVSFWESMTVKVATILSLRAGA